MTLGTFTLLSWAAQRETARAGRRRPERERPSRAAGRAPGPLACRRPSGLAKAEARSGSKLGPRRFATALSDPNPHHLDGSMQHARRVGCAERSDRRSPARGACGLSVVDRAGRAPRPGLSVGYRRDQASMGASSPGGLALRPGSVSEVRDSACSRVGTGDEQSRSGRRAVSRACWNSSCAGAAESQHCVPGAYGLRLSAVWVPASATSFPGLAWSGRNDNRRGCSFAFGRGARRSAGVGSRMRGSEE